MAAVSGSFCCSTSDAPLLLTPPPSAAIPPDDGDDDAADDLDIELADHHHQYQSCNRRAKRRKRLSLPDGIDARLQSTASVAPAQPADADLFDADEDDKARRKKALQQTYALRSNPKRSRRFLDPDYVALESINGGGSACGGGAAAARDDGDVAAAASGEIPAATLECDPDSGVENQQLLQLHPPQPIDHVKKPPPDASADASHGGGSGGVANRPPARAARCTECGKQFASWKALFGHMRCHPERQWRGIQPPPNHDKFYVDRSPARYYAAAAVAGGRRQGGGRSKAANSRRHRPSATPLDHRDYSSEDQAPPYSGSPYAVHHPDDDDDCCSGSESNGPPAVDVPHLRHLASATVTNSSDSETESIEAAYINHRTSSVDCLSDAVTPIHRPAGSDLDASDPTAEPLNHDRNCSSSIPLHGSHTEHVPVAPPDADRAATKAPSPDAVDFDVHTCPAEDKISATVVDEERDMADCALVMLAFAAYKSKPPAIGDRRSFGSGSHMHQPSRRQSMIIDHLEMGSRTKAAVAVAEHRMMPGGGGSGLGTAKRKAKAKKSKQSVGIFLADDVKSTSANPSAISGGFQPCYAAASYSSARPAENAGNMTAAASMYGIFRREDHTETSGGCRFQCTTCKKTFRSHQALGGHRASHKRVKGCFARTNSGGLEGAEAVVEQVNYVDAATQLQRNRQQAVALPHQPHPYGSAHDRSSGKSGADSFLQLCSSSVLAEPSAAAAKGTPPLCSELSRSPEDEKSEQLRHTITAEELNFTLANVAMTIGGTASSRRPAAAAAAPCDVGKRAAVGGDDAERAQRLQEMGHFLQCSVLQDSTLCSYEDSKLRDGLQEEMSSTERSGIMETASEAASTTVLTSESRGAEVPPEKRQQPDHHHHLVNMNTVPPWHHGTTVAAAAGGPATPPPGCRHHSYASQLQPIKNHQCSICHRVFSTGQALGGHKRCHWVGHAVASPAGGMNAAAHPQPSIGTGGTAAAAGTDRREEGGGGGVCISECSLAGGAKTTAADRASEAAVGGAGTAESGGEAVRGSSSEDGDGTTKHKMEEVAEGGMEVAEEGGAAAGEREKVGRDCIGAVAPAAPVAEEELQHLDLNQLPPASCCSITPEI